MSQKLAMRSACRLKIGLIREIAHAYQREHSYLWNIIHCDTVTMLSCVSFKVDSFALRASSEKDIVTGPSELRPQLFTDTAGSFRLHCAQGTETLLCATRAITLVNCSD